MIHNTFLMSVSKREVLASTKYWPVAVNEEQLQEFMSTRQELQGLDRSLKEAPLIIGNSLFLSNQVSDDILLIFACDKNENEHSLQDRLTQAVRTLNKHLMEHGLKSLISEYTSLIDPFVITRLKIALVGEGGVGKTTTLRLLLGETPPTQYVPTIALNLETVENIRFGSYSLVIWDFAGQERFRTLWKFYFHGADVIFLVTDSSLRNVLISKDILKLIRRDAPKVPIFAIANKQDKPEAMKPEIIQKILGVPTYPMVAIDVAKRNYMLQILMNAAASYVGIALPDLPPSEILRFTSEEKSKPSAAKREPQESHTGTKKEEEYVELVEEVYIDEEGNIVDAEEGEFEVIEEVVEEVDRESAATTRSSTTTEAAVEEEDRDVTEEEMGHGLEEQHGISEPASCTDVKTSVETVAQDNGGRRLATEIISHELDADEIIIDELESASLESIDHALEAFRSQETTANDHSTSSAHVISDEEQTGLESVLGKSDKKTSDTEEGAAEDRPFDVDQTTRTELERILMGQRETEEGDSETDEHDE